MIQDDWPLFKISGQAAAYTIGTAFILFLQLNILSVCWSCGGGQAMIAIDHSHLGSTPSLYSAYKDEWKYLLKHCYHIVLEH